MEYIKTSDGDSEWPPTYRKKTSADFLEEVVREVEQNRKEEKEGRKKKEKLNWRLLLGLKNPQ